MPAGFVTSEWKLDDRGLRRIIQGSRAEVDALVSQLASVTLERTKALCPYDEERDDPRYDEHLRDTFHKRRIGLSSYEVYSEDPRAVMVEFGVPGGYPIYPDKATVLHWTEGGEDVFRAYVANHPGQEGQHFMEEAAELSIIAGLPTLSRAFRNWLYAWTNY